MDEKEYTKKIMEITKCDFDLARKLYCDIIIKENLRIHMDSYNRGYDNGYNSAYTGYKKN